MATQKERWLYYAELSSEKYKEVDKQMMDDIKKHRVPHERTYLTKLWQEEVQTSEHKAEKQNDRELDELSTLQASDPYSGYVQSATSESHPNGGFYKRRYYSNRQQGNRSQRNSPFQ